MKFEMISLITIVLRLFTKRILLRITRPEGERCSIVRVCRQDFRNRF